MTKVDKTKLYINLVGVLAHKYPTRTPDDTDIIIKQAYTLATRAYEEYGVYEQELINQERELLNEQAGT